MQLGNCKNADPAAVVFFPGRGQTTSKAKKLCEDCPVKQDCLEYAKRNDIEFGVWGGEYFSPRQ